MIRATGLTLRRGTKVLLDGADFIVNPGERVGVIGKNGAGKTTLFALLKGQLDADAGTLTLPPGWRIAAVEQDVAHDTQPAREFVIDGDTHLRSLQAQRAALDNADGTASDTGATAAHAQGGAQADAGSHPSSATLHDDAIGQRIAELEAALVEAQAWSAPSRAEQLLAGLGFTPDQWMTPVNQFSGGWRMRLALARALMAPSELLLLDEPTNHLDLDAMLWLERWLSAYPGTVLVISHDTEFLDSVVRNILHFDQGKLQGYRGDYTGFLVQRAERLRQTRLAWERQTRETARLQGFIDRFKAKASKAKQAQSRVKALARMQTLAPLHAEAGIDIRIPDPEGMPDPLLVLEDVTTGYQADDGRPLPILDKITLMVRGGSRIGILGVNGAGKSTLVKTLAGELPALGGERRASRGLEVGYFAQHQLDMLDLDASPLQHLARIAPQAREQELRNYLGGFGFGGEAATSKVAPMSGGEKARLALSLIVWRKPNLLLLDEPSNHLDVDTREALAAALAEFGGSVLLVSHDRHLLRTTVDDFWIVADGRVMEFDGDLDDYRQWLAERTAALRAQARQQGRGQPDAAADGATLSGDTAADGDGQAVTAQDRKLQRRQEAEQRQRLSALRKPLEKQLAQVESRMDALRTRQQELDTLIADPDLYSDTRRDERQRTMEEHGQAQKTLAELEDQWLELQEQMEALQ